MANASIRPYGPDDLEALYDICLRTGDAGQDASHLYQDPKLLGHLFAAPYAIYEPELALVLEDAQGVCGYILGALDSDAFYARLERDWWPALRGRYPEPQGESQAWSPDERLMHVIHHPRRALPKTLKPYPSHLHIDLLPRAQGQGWGGALMRALLGRLREKRSPAVHLGVAAGNTRAQGFYSKMGFHEIVREGEGIYLGMRLGADEGAGEHA